MEFARSGVKEREWLALQEVVIYVYGLRAEDGVHWKPESCCVPAFRRMFWIYVRACWVLSCDGSMGLGLCSIEAEPTPCLAPLPICMLSVISLDEFKVRSLTDAFSF